MNAATQRQTIVELLVLSACALGTACSGASRSEADWGADLPPSASVEETFEVPPPPFTPGIFPCSDCHDPSVPVNTKRRELTLAHTDIHFTHDSEHRWCLDCHDAADRDQLHLASGEKLSFEESFRLCGQCHGDKYRDWKVGVHGRRSGNWDGHKTYLLCVSCHNAHSPHFAPIKPEPPPRQPQRTP